MPLSEIVCCRPDKRSKIYTKLSSMSKILALAKNIGHLLTMLSTYSQYSQREKVGQKEKATTKIQRSFGNIYL